MYKSYSDSELVEAYSTMIDYSGKASEELLTEIEIRGGLESFLAKIENNKINQNEAVRVLSEIIRLIEEGYTFKEINETITSEIWTPEHLNAFIENRYFSHQLYLKDKNIDRQVIIASILGSIISSIVGSIIWAFSIIYFRTFFYPILIFVFIISYFITRAISGKTSNNIVVFVACFMSTIASLFLGTILYSNLDK